MKFGYSEVIEAEIDDSDVIEAVAKQFSPEDVFPKSELEQWAEENGYIQPGEAEG